ncbi:hypothetical protein EJ06DRAFT_53637 [Trichodelitschia bisporula]|uniref:Uncharacterized protein n=1 Tax=Trichodelitschia bisporula TaxID=703511 RepID=A0A6G1HU00_9PEZI|nr:hypothetical protein EJ06DRAFT_53637 [Trichodelitschia bisporula]
MKSLPLLAALLAAAGAAVIPEDLEKRQLGGLISLFTGPAKKPTVLKTLTPAYDPKATRAMYMYGPFKLPAANAKHAATGFSSSGIKLDPNSDTPGGAIEPPCKGCTVLKAVANFAYKDGKQADIANGVYTHHIIIADFAGKSQLMPPVNPPRCANGAVISPIPPMSGMGPKPPGAAEAPAGGMAGMSHGGAAPAPAAGMAGMSHGGAAPATTGGMAGMGHSHSKRQLGLSVFIGGGGSVGSGNPFSPRPGSNIRSGYWIGTSGNMQLTSELVNYDNSEKEIYLTLDVEWVPGKDPAMLDVGMGALSADRCEDKEKGILHPPKDKAIVYKGEEWTVIDDGYFMNFTPHIHDGGVNIKVFVNGKEVCEARAEYGDEGGSTKAPDGKSWQTITGYTPCDTPVPIKKGDKVYMTSEYDLTKHRL